MLVLAGRPEDIPNFLRFEPAEDRETKAQLERLNRIATDAGWEQALREVYPDNPALLRYVTGAERASFIDLLPIGPTSDVLEIGPGLGQFTSRLAARAKSVHALEVVPGQSRFVAQRCRQEGARNVRVATGGDDCRLPYAAGSFDVVVLNLVFEWCAGRCTDEPAADVQRRLLSEVFRVLRPGGTLYMATKNRFALRYLLGKPDEHSFGMRFGSVLPRWLRRLMLSLRQEPTAPGLLHSHAALGTMIRQAGFDAVDSFWATPEVRYPQAYVPTDAASVRAARRDGGFVQGESRLTRWLMPRVPAPLVKHVAPGLCFVARRR